MYCRAKPLREENHKPRKSHRNTPSFSSTLLDEIYRSIDGGNADKAHAEDSTAHREKIRSKSHNGGGRRSTTGDNHEKAARFPRGCLVRSNDKDSLSSFCSIEAKSEVSRPHYNTNPNQMEEDCHDQLTKSKSRALKVYTKMKKMKQPISPGKRLSNFINSLFTNLNSKKFKKQDLLQQQSPKVLSSSSTPSSTYSSSLSTPSSMMDKNKVVVMMRNNNNHQKHYGRPPLPPNASVHHRNIIRRESDFSMFENVHYEEDDGEDDDDDDGVSDSSSDLFELDHLVLFGNNNIFCQELPVYETTYFDKNRAVATGLF